jgi:hypothetical protein
VDIRYEIEFWTRIMRDHGEFIYDSLASNEIEAINTAQYFRSIFETLHQEVMSNQSLANDLISKSRTALTQFIDFKRYLLARLLTCNIMLGLTPTFLNHMINEALEFLNVLNLADGTIPLNNTIELLRLHNIWLPDASGHASSISAELDPTESEYIKISHEFITRFDNLDKKAFSMYTMYERTRLVDGTIHHFNDQVIRTVTEFVSFLKNVEELRTKCSVLSAGTFIPLMIRHIILEGEYYIYKINELSA